jgi:hypothetical protein
MTRKLLFIAASVTLGFGLGWALMAWPVPALALLSVAATGAYAIDRAMRLSEELELARVQLSIAKRRSRILASQLGRNAQ